MLFKSLPTVSTLLVAITLVLGGCASMPSADVMKAEVANYQLPKLPAEGQAMVYVVRPSIVGSLIRFNVFLDDKEASSEMGYTRGKQYIYFSVAPGNHTVYSKAENWAQNLVDVKAGDIIFLQQNPAMGIVMARNDLFKIDDYQGKYQVKNLSVGTILKEAK